jgi:copper chaperone CopZ
MLLFVIATSPAFELTADYPNISVPTEVFKKPKPGRTTKIKIRSSIQCGKCIDRINTELPKLKGVKSVQYDLTKKLVIVRFVESEVTPDQIRTQLTKIGYDADEMAADPQAYQNLPTCCQKGGH